GGLTALGEAPEEGADPNAVERETLTSAASEAGTALDSAVLARDEAFQALLDNNDINDYSFMVLFESPYAASLSGNAYAPPSRIAQTAWPGTLNDFVHGTLVAGRPTSSSYWPQPMAAWSQET